MKKFLPIALLASLVFASNANASILNANNNSTSPEIYTTLQAAITAAHAGDTILVAGSNTDYAAFNTSITINKPLTIWGTGYNLLKDNPLTSKVSTIDLQSGSNGTVISGLVVSNSIYSDNTQINSITIKRNYINGLTDAQGDGWLIQENLFGYGNSSVSVNGNNIVVKNNIFQGSPYVSFGNQSANTGLVFSNNLIFGNTYASNTFYNAVVSNNIFYDSSKSSIFYASASSANTSFSSNIVYGDPNTNPFNTTINGNTESLNKYNTDPQFTSLKMRTDPYGFFEAIDLSVTGDYTLRATSPGHNAGTDGKDIGLYGGSGSQNPLTGNPPIPQISTMNILNTVIAPGTILNVALKAKSNN